jgi:NADPH:quinone reductase-like Zn-dependent oxidoreductase
MQLLQKIPEPQNDELLIGFGYAGVNPSDSKARLGQSHRSKRGKQLALIRQTDQPQES